MSSFNFGPVVSSITFDTPGYTIQSGYIEGGANGLTITTNADATISSTLEESTFNGNSLIKDGTGTLTVSGINFLGSLQINQGEFDAVGTSSTFFSNVSLANTPGVIVTLDESSASMQSLSGGGTLGGIVQPGSSSSTTFTIFGGGEFGGVLQDNGSNQLGLQVYGGETLTNANTYSGPTTILSGTLTFSGNGSALNSAVNVTGPGSLVLDNSSVANASRLSSTAAITMQSGQIQMIGNSTAPVEQAIGNLDFSGAASIAVIQSGTAAALLTFAGLTRNGLATLSISGSGVTIGGLSNGGNGIIGPYITAGNDWATVGINGQITAYADYASTINGGSTTDNVKITTSGTTTLATATTRASLNLQSSGAPQVLDLGSQQGFGLSSGGILSSGSGTSTIQNGYLYSTAPEWVVTTNNNLTISSPIQEAGNETDLTKSGTGTLTLSGQNSYAGTTTIDQGTLVVSSDSNLGAGPTIQFGGGELQAAASFSSSKGFTTSTAEAGIINTGGFNVTFSGSNAGAITKTGAGMLTLTTPNTGTTFVTSGTLALPNATSGNSTLGGGTLLASGTLSGLSVNSSSTLDIAGAAAGNLVIGSIQDFPAVPLTINFGIGSTSSDLWTIEQFNSFEYSQDTFLFNFQNLGGVTTGVDYPLIDSPYGIFIPTDLPFALAPNMAAAGWSGTFITTSTSVSVDFSSLPATVPEPGEAALLALASVSLVPGVSRMIRRRFDPT